jgi:hypothetical protein
MKVKGREQFQTALRGMAHFVSNRAIPIHAQTEQSSPIAMGILAFSNRTSPNGSLRRSTFLAQDIPVVRLLLNPINSLVVRGNADGAVRASTSRCRLTDEAAVRTRNIARTINFNSSAVLRAEVWRRTGSRRFEGWAEMFNTKIWNRMRYPARLRTWGLGSNGTVNRLKGGSAQCRSVSAYVAIERTRRLRLRSCS